MCDTHVTFKGETKRIEREDKLCIMCDERGDRERTSKTKQKKIQKLFDLGFL